MTALRSGELFAGVGGLGMAVDDVFNASPAWFCEFDAAPSKVLAHHFPDVPNFGDVRAVDWRTVERVNVIAGGFPCQDVSLAGRRRGLQDGTRSGLWSEFAKAIDEIRPDWVVIENVRGLLSADAAVDLEPCPLCVGDDPGHVLRALGAVLGDLADLGFDAEWTGIRASDVGAPHGRFRVFILAWPRERTVADSGHRSGHRERAREGSRVGESGAGLKLLPTPTASEGEKGGPNQAYGSGGATLSGTVPHLLPTPRTTDMNGDGAHGDGGMDLRTSVALLPTPMVGSSNPAAHGQISGDFRAAMDRVLSAVTLLPTPSVSNSHGNEVNGRGEALLPGVVNLLPTPTVGNATGGNAQRGGDRADEKLLPGLATEHATDWGPYAPAIRRAEAVFGRPAPAPVRFDGKGGKPRLNPELTEWMMGWPLGWVTASVIGLSRAEQLKACGNGVVPQQAAAALRSLLARPGVPAIDWGLAA